MGNHGLFLALRTRKTMLCWLARTFTKGDPMPDDPQRQEQLNGLPEPGPDDTQEFVPVDTDVHGPQRPDEPEQEPAFTLIEEQFAQTTLSAVAREAMLEIEVGQLKSQISERDKLIDDTITERNKIKDALGAASVKVGALSTELAQLQEHYDSLLQPAWSFAVVARVNTEDGTADIISEGRRHRVGVHAAIDIDTLRVGQRVILNGKTMAVQQIADDIERTGIQASVSQWLDERTALVEDSRGDRRVVIAGDGIKPETVETGTDVLLDESVIVHPINKAGNIVSLGLGSRFLLAEMPDVTFDDIGGLDKELERLVASLENPHRVPEGFAALKKKPTFSVFLMGLPGNGKTMIAKAIARRQFDLHRDEILKYAKGNFFAVGGTEMYEKWLGNTEGYLRSVFTAAQRLYQLTGAISTVFFDDCESFFLTRSAGLSTNINGSVVTQFSTVVDGIRAMTGVNLIGASNRLDLVDLAVVRRFDRQIRIKPPDTPERAAAILRKKLQDIPLVGLSTEEAVQQLVADIFAPTRDNEIVEVYFKKAEEGEDSVVFRLRDLISGKFIADIVENAKDLAIEREAVKPEAERTWALTYEDLRTSMETELRSKESIPTTEAAIADWLMQKGDKREVDFAINLREKRKGQARRDKALDEKVV